MNNNSNNNEFNNKLYNSVFNNIYLKRIIFNHLNKYNILYNNIKFTSHKEYQQFKYKEYLNSVSLDYDIDNLSKLPDNIKQIIIVKKKSILNNLNSIPNHIESIRLASQYYDFEIKSIISTINSDILSKIHYLNIDLSNNRYPIELKKSFQNVTNLKIDSLDKIELKKEMLPSNLQRICLERVHSIENGCILESLSSATLFYCSPLIINQILSNNLVKLEFKCKTDSSYYKFDNSIIFPETLQELSIQCYSFSSKLPNNLKSFSLITHIYQDTTIFPSSLEHLKISSSVRDKPLFNNKESVPCNLKSLEFECSSIVDNNGQSILPDKLEKLVFYSHQHYSFNQKIQVNQLPSSLTYLHLGNLYNQVIDINVLPPNLKTLSVGYRFNQIINPLAIPKQLELLIMGDYPHSINLPFSTHPNKVISSDNLKISLYYNEQDTSIRKLKLPFYFNSSLSTLKLQDKSSLECLLLGYCFNKSIGLSDLPINNNIKTLEVGYKFNQIINLEYFQNLETIILDRCSNPIITTTTITTTTAANQQDIAYNNYNLKNIIVSPNNTQFIINLDINFYQFIKIKKQ